MEAIKVSFSSLQPSYFDFYFFKLFLLLTNLAEMFQLLPYGYPSLRSFLVRMYIILKCLCQYIGIPCLKKHQVFWWTYILVFLYCKIHMIFFRYTLKRFKISIRNLNVGYACVMLSQVFYTLLSLFVQMLFLIMGGKIRFDHLL